MDGGEASGLLERLSLVSEVNLLIGGKDVSRLLATSISSNFSNFKNCWLIFCNVTIRLCKKLEYSYYLNFIGVQIKNL